jgi:uncharacterized protein (TIGR00159 family)
VSDWIQSVSPSDLLDIAVVAFLVYRVLVILRGTRALRILVGLGMLAALYAVAQLLKLTTLHWILEEVSLYLVLAVIVLFQEDIRRALARVGNPLFGAGSRREPLSVYQPVARACFRLADQGRGALIAVERDASLEELGEQAVLVDAVLSEELLVAIFQTASPIHDGAAVVRKDRLWVAGAFLPLSTRADLPGALGTRHRAAVGQSEQNDSMVFVVSEERRAVSIVFRGDIHPVDSPDELRLKVQELLQAEQQLDEQGGSPRMGSTGAHNRVQGPATAGALDSEARSGPRT